MQPRAPDAEPGLPAFDNSRLALDFALNASQVEMPRPFMNKAMAEVIKKLPRISKKRRAQMLRDGMEDALALLERENAGKRRSARPGPPPFRGLDRAHQAGFILAQLNRLDRSHRTILKGLMIHAYDPCPCRSACCQGFRRNLRWAEAVKETCYLLKEVGDITRAPGKKGLGTQPELRLVFVEHYFTKSALTVAEAARIAQVSTMTATRHRDWIFAYLEQTENEAWLSVDAIFDQAGITGSFD